MLMDEYSSDFVAPRALQLIVNGTNGTIDIPEADSSGPPILPILLAGLGLAGAGESETMTYTYEEDDAFLDEEYEYDEEYEEYFEEYE